MMGKIMTTMKALENIMDLANKVTIFDIALNTWVAWDMIPEVATCKCFRGCDIHLDIGQPQTKKT